MSIITAQAPTTPRAIDRPTRSQGNTTSPLLWMTWPRTLKILCTFPELTLNWSPGVRRINFFLLIRITLMLNSTGKRLPSQSRDLVPVSQILMTDVYVTMHGPQVGDQSTATTRWREIHGTLSPGQSPRQQRGAGIGITAHQCMPCSAGKQNSPTLILGQEVGH